MDADSVGIPVACEASSLPFHYFATNDLIEWTWLNFGDGSVPSTQFPSGKRKGFFPSPSLLLCLLSSPCLKPFFITKIEPVPDNGQKCALSNLNIYSKCELEAAIILLHLQTPFERPAYALQSSFSTCEIAHYCTLDRRVILNPVNHGHLESSKLALEYTVLSRI